MDKSPYARASEIVRQESGRPIVILLFCSTSAGVKKMINVDPGLSVGTAPHSDVCLLSLKEKGKGVDLGDFSHVLFDAQESSRRYPLVEI